MLVYCKNPMGYTSIDGKRIYGRYFARGSMPPTQLNYSSYYKNRGALESSPYTKEWLEKEYGSFFPNVSFIGQRDLSLMAFQTLVQIVRAMGVDYRDTKGKWEDEKAGLIETILRLLGDK